MKSRISTPGRFHFGKKRLLRLWPALAVATIVLTMFIGPVASSLPAAQYFGQYTTWHFLWRNLLFVPVYYLPGVFQGHAVNSPFWTLFYEMLCYGILFLLPANWLRGYRHWFLGGLAAVFFVKLFSTVVVPFPFWLTPYVYGISNMMVLFAAGSVYWLFEKSIPTSKGFLFMMLLLLLATIIFPLPQHVGPVLQAISLLFLVIGFGKSTAVLHWPSWDVSYGLYLWAFPVQQIVVYHLLGLPQLPEMVLGITLLLTIPIAALSWWGVERPFLQLKNRKIGSQFLNGG